MAGAERNHFFHLNLRGGAEQSGELGRGQGTEASEGWREPVYHCLLTQGWKEQSQGTPYGEGRPAQN